MSEEERERVLQILKELDNTHRQLYVHIHKITILMAVSDTNTDAIMHDIITAFGHVGNVLTTSRYRILRGFYSQFPDSELNDTETENQDSQQNTNNVSQ